jgi:diadenosine tetraphosphate (Ap4A) HIT family hydrolase
MNLMDNCPICTKHNGNEAPLYEGENWVVYPGDFHSQIPGYIYLEPKQHIENWKDFSTAELAEMGSMIKDVEVTLNRVIDLERLYTVTISEQVRHIHLHLIPRTTKEDRKGTLLIQAATQGSQLVSINAEQYEVLRDQIISAFNS